MSRLIITVAPCAPPAQLNQHPDLPRTPEQIADEVVRAWRAGAAVAHLHVLDENGLPSQLVDAFHRTVELIRARCDILIEGSTGGLTGFTAQERSVALQAEIDLASLNPGSVNSAEGAYINTPQDIAYWVTEMHRQGIKPDIAIFEAGMIKNAMEYVCRGEIGTPPLFNLVLGQPGAMPATARNLLFLVGCLPREAVWGTTGHSGHDLDAALWSLAFGGHVRAGFEDNVWYRAGERAPCNAALVERLARIAREIGRDVATPAEAREILALRGA